MLEIQSDCGEIIKLIRVEKNPRRKISIFNTYISKLTPRADIQIVGFIREFESDENIGWINWLTVVAPKSVKISDFFDFNFQLGTGTHANLKSLREQKLKDLDCDFETDLFYTALINYKESKTNPDEVDYFDATEFTEHRNFYLKNF